MSDPVTASFLLLLAFGLGAVVGLMARPSERDTYQPIPPVSEPPRHVAAVRIGDCAMCHKDGVRVHLHRVHPLLDPEDLCDGCMHAEVEA